LWLKDFDKQTCEKKKDWPRLLLLDGHNSHYTLEFMQYAKSVNIHVLCYPSHCTHVLQGLNVVVFASFKKIWTRCRDQWITDNPFVKFGKLAWIAVWTAAFLEAMTESTIKSSFRATGVIPFNPGVVTPRMMAPSIQHSTCAELPGPLASPVKKMINHHRAILRQSERAPSPTPIHPSQDVHMFDVSAEANATADNDASSDIMDVESDGHDIVPCAVTVRCNREHRQRASVQVVIDPELLADCEGGQSLAAALATSSASILVSEETLTCAYRLPELVYGPRPVIPAMDMNVLHRPTATSPVAMAAQIEDMRAALEASHAREKVHLDTHDAMGAQLALAGMYVSKTQLQLANAEERKKRAKGVRIDSNGMARYITHSTLLALGEKLDQDKLTKISELEYRARQGEEWKAFNEEQLEAHEVWKAEKARCKAEGIAVMMAPPNPLLRKWEWTLVYQAFEEANDVINNMADGEAGGD
jgi:hypothetical protein